MPYEVPRGGGGAVLGATNLICGSPEEQEFLCVAPTDQRETYESEVCKGGASETKNQICASEGKKRCDEGEGGGRCVGPTTRRGERGIDRRKMWSVGRL